MTTWTTVPLAEVAEIRGGATPLRGNAEYWNGDIPWLTPTDLPRVGAGITNVQETADSITQEGLGSCSASLLPRGTVLFSSRASIGKVGIADVPLATNQGFANFIPRDGLGSRYLAWCLSHHASQIARLAGSTTFKEVTKKSLRRFPIPLPPPAEQRRIVKILDRVDRLRQLRAKADARADRILGALFLRMFGHADSVGPEQRFDELVKIGGPFVEPNQREYLDLPHVGGQQIEKNTGRILSAVSVKESQLRSGKFFFTEQHVLYSKIRPYLNKVAYPRFSGLCSADIYPLLPRDRRIAPWFLTALLRSEAFRNYAKGQSERLRIPKLNRAQIGSYAVRVPHHRALAAFESRAEQLALTERKRLQSRTRIDSLFGLVMHRSFRGEVTAPSREAEVTELEHQAVASTQTE